MVFKINIKPIVFIDAEEALLYYEKKAKGLGKRFYNNFLLAIDNIQLRPFSYTFVIDTVRRCRIDKFPYKIFYVVEKDTIAIIGLSHAKRSNAFIKRRLKLI